MLFILLKEAGCEYNNKDENNSLKTLNDKNHQPSSQEFRQLNLLCSTLKLFNFIVLDLLVFKIITFKIDVKFWGTSCILFY